MATTPTSELFWQMGTPSAKVPTTQDSQTLPMFNAQEVEPDAANNTCEGDMGGAC